MEGLTFIREAAARAFAFSASAVQLVLKYDCRIPLIGRWKLN
jgi:hypothetical protein